MIPADPGGDGTAAVELGPSDVQAMTKMMTQLKSDQCADPVTEADLRAGPGAARPRAGDKGHPKAFTPPHAKRKLPPKPSARRPLMGNHKLLWDGTLS